MYFPRNRRFVFPASEEVQNSIYPKIQSKLKKPIQRAMSRYVPTGSNGFASFCAISTWSCICSTDSKHYLIFPHPTAFRLPADNLLCRHLRFEVLSVVPPKTFASTRIQRQRKNPNNERKRRYSRGLSSLCSLIDIFRDGQLAFICQRLQPHRSKTWINQ
jgi:hypothetical protein